MGASRPTLRPFGAPSDNDRITICAVPATTQSIIPSVSAMRRTILASAAVATALLLAGCSASSTTASGGPVQLVEPGSGSQSDGSFTSEGGGAAGSDATTKVDQSVITTGWMTVTVDDPTAATDQAVTIVDQLNGRIDSRTLQAGTDNQRPSAQLTVRIPSDSVDKAVDELGALGTVEQVSLSANDVTLQVRDLDAQIKALQASVDRLLALVGQAATTADLVQLETAISDRQSQLDSLTSQKQYLADQISYSTITLDLQQKGVLPTNVPGDFWSGLATGWASLTAALSGFVVVIGVLIPWLLPLAVIAAIVVLVVVLSRRAKKPRAPHGPSEPRSPNAPQHPQATDATQPPHSAPTDATTPSAPPAPPTH